LRLSWPAPPFRYDARTAIMFAMQRLTAEELEEMRRLARMGYLPSFGGVMTERDEDPVIPLRRSKIAEYQYALLRAVEEIERLYKQ
jgi:hypothetical protein